MDPNLKQWGVIGLGILIVGFVVIAVSALLPSSSEISAVPLVSPTGESSGPGVVLTVNNHTTEVICSLYVSPAGAEGWGDNRLGEVVLMPGQIWEMQVMRGRYRLQVRNCFDYVLAEEEALIDRDTEWSIVSEQVISMTLESVGP